MSESADESEFMLLDLKKQYVEGIEAKLTAIEDQWQGMQDGFDQEKYESIILKVHRFAGSGAMYGFTAISEAAGNFERILVEIRESGSPPALHQAAESYSCLGALGLAIRASLLEVQGKDG